MNLEDQVRHQLRKVGHANNTEVSYGIGFGFFQQSGFRWTRGLGLCGGITPQERFTPTSFGCAYYEGMGETNLFIKPPYEFKQIAANSKR